MSIQATDRVSTGVDGLDDVLGGGLTPNRMYLVEGSPGVGKTTLALQFLLDGADKGETGLYVTLSEAEAELRANAATHGFSLDAITILEALPADGLDPTSEQTVLHSSELELGETIARVTDRIAALRPKRIVFDSLAEFRLLAQSPLRFRREVMALKRHVTQLGAIMLLLDDRTVEPTNQQLHSIVHGVVQLEHLPADYGVERRRLRVVKMRGTRFQGGYHDVGLDTGGLRVFPRLVASDHQTRFSPAPVSTGLPMLDALLGGGLTPGANLLLRGPSGVGKTTTAVHCMAAAARAGLRGFYYLFDEGLATLRLRADQLRFGLDPLIEDGRCTLEQIDPATLSPGEFATKVRHAVEAGCRFVVIDSLNAYLQSMPGQQFLLLHMHELLTYLNQQGVVTLLILGQHGTGDNSREDVDLSYLSDAVMLFRYFEAEAEVRTAVSVVKSRTLPHQRSIREFRIGAGGLAVGKVLTEMEGLLGGTPVYRGRATLLSDPDQMD